MSEPLLKVENLVQHFPVSRTYTVKAVNGVSFNICLLYTSDAADEL